MPISRLEYKNDALFMTKMAKIGSNRYPIYDQNGWKAIPIGAAHTYKADSSPVVSRSVKEARVNWGREMKQGMTRPRISMRQWETTGDESAYKAHIREYPPPGILVYFLKTVLITSIVPVKLPVQPDRLDNINSDSNIRL